MRAGRITPALLLSLALVAGACGGDDDTTDTTAPGRSPTTTAGGGDGTSTTLGAEGPTTTTPGDPDDFIIWFTNWDERVVGRQNVKSG